MNMSKPVLVSFDSEKRELQISIGDENLIIPDFVRNVSKVGEIFHLVLSAHGQEKIIKALVKNIILSDV